MAEMDSIFDETIKWASQREVAVRPEVQTGSTNDNAKAQALQENESVILYMASHQTAGRGRSRNSWLDTGAGESLLSTWSFRCLKAPQAITGPRIGLSLFLACRKVWPSLNWALKAPNDLYLEGTKVAGLLIESVTNGSEYRVLIGLGLNVLNHPRSFANANHLAAALGRRPDEDEWFRFLDELKLQFEQGLQESQSAQLSSSVCEDLKQALNANPNLPFEILEVSPLGDLTHKSGIVRWSEL